MCAALNNNALMDDSHLVSSQSTRRAKKKWHINTKANQIYVYIRSATVHTWSRLTTASFSSLKTMPTQLTEHTAPNIKTNGQRKLRCRAFICSFYEDKFRSAYAYSLSYNVVLDVIHISITIQNQRAHNSHTCST